MRDFKVNLYVNTVKREPVVNTVKANKQPVTKKRIVAIVKPSRRVKYHKCGRFKLRNRDAEVFALQSTSSNLISYREMVNEIEPFLGNNRMTKDAVEYIRNVVNDYMTEYFRFGWYAALTSRRKTLLLRHAQLARMKMERGLTKSKSYIQDKFLPGCNLKVVNISDKELLDLESASRKILKMDADEE